MFRAGLLPIIRRINCVQTAIGIVMRYVDWLLQHRSAKRKGNLLQFIACLNV
jgi:hypothetical protein